MSYNKIALKLQDFIYTKGANKLTAYLYAKN
jgi:hypothetical protein